MDKWQKLKDFLTEGKQNISKDVFVSRPSVFEEILVIMEELEKRELSELNGISAKNDVSVENIITKEEVIQWIPTSERQPEHTGDYLVTIGINYDGAGMFDCIRVASYNTCFGWGLYEKNDIHTLFGEITAWAELPKIYS